MIVHPINTGWEIIHQQAHGLLAFQVAAQWRIDQRPAHWAETLSALIEHDDGQDPYEGRNHISDAGAPLQFGSAYSVDQCKNMVEIGRHKSRWNALMVSHHASFLYERDRGKDAELDTFLDQQKANQTVWQKAYKATRKEVMYAYDFVQWCDAMSLILCRRELPPEGRQLEISRGPDGATYFILQRTDDKTLNVTPWPFQVDTFSVHVEVYPVNQLHFADDAEFYTVLNTAPIETREWTFRK